MDDGGAKLLAARAPRVRPGLDDKVLADWNGLMIAALAEAGLAFERAEWVALAARAFAFIRERMTGADGRLRHSWREDQARHPASVDDYANLCRAALVLHEATADPADRRSMPTPLPSRPRIVPGKRRCPDGRSTSPSGT